MENNELKGGLSMADVEFAVETNMQPGDSASLEEICRWVCAFSREDKKKTSVYIGRLAQRGLLKPDKYKRGAYRRVKNLSAYDLSGTSQVSGRFPMTMPLDLINLLMVMACQLIVIAGRFDAGKSSFLFDVMQRCFTRMKIVYFVTVELSLDHIKERMDLLHIPRPHENITVYPMEPGYEDNIPEGPCIVLVDYIRTNENPRDIDLQFYRILENLKGGICLAAIQKNIGADRPTGGQFAMHAPHHVILLDKTKQGDFICKIAKSKNSRDLEGLYRTFKFNESRKLIPVMDTWKKGEILWERQQSQQ